MSVFSLPPLRARVGVDIYTQSGVPPPPATSTGNDKSDAMRADVHKYAAAAAIAEPELAPYLAAGVLIFDGWVALGAFLSGESKDDQRYQTEAARAVSDFLGHGFIPRKWVSDVEFAADYASFLETQIQGFAYALVAGTAPAPKDPFVYELCTDLGLTLGEFSKDPEVTARIKKGNMSPCGGGVPDPGWKYGLYDSYPMPDVLGLAAAKRFGGTVVARTTQAQAMLADLRAKGVVLPTRWPTDALAQADLAAKGTAVVWSLLGGKSRGFYLLGDGTKVGTATVLYKPSPPTGATGGGPSIGQDTVKLAITGGAIYLGYKFLWPAVKRWL